MIKFVYFDVGGVVIRDFSETNKWEQFKKDFNLTDEYWDEHEPEFDRGKPLPNPNLVSEFVKRFEKNETIWPVIEEFKKHFRLGLLTNMYPKMFEEIKQKNLLPGFEWEIIIDSSLEGVGKPDKGIYEIAQKKAGVKNEEILFIDNTQKNLETAKSLGWRTFLYDSKDYKLSSKNLLEYINQILR